MARRDTRLNIDITATDNASDDLRRVGDEADKLDTKFGNLDLGSIAGPAALAGAAGLAKSYGDAAIDAQVLADLTGSTVEEASRLQTVFKNTADGDANDLADIILQMNDVLSESPDIVTDLGIEFESSGNSVADFLNLVDLINESELTAQEKAKVLGELFGEEGVRQVQKMISTVGDLETAVEDVPDAAVITAADVARAQRFAEQWAKIQSYLQVIAGLTFDGFTGFFGMFDQGEENQSFENPFTNGPSALGTAAFFRERDAQRLAASQLPNVAGAISGALDQARVTIINPPGTPTTTVNSSRQYERRNLR